MLWELLTADIQRIWIRSTQFFGELLDTLVDVRHRIDANDTRVCRWEERLHHNHVVCDSVYDWKPEKTGLLFTALPDSQCLRRLNHE